MISIILLIALALVFDYFNGYNDAANSVATVISTRVLSPRVAVCMAAFFNVIAFLFFEMHIAKTIGGGIIDISIVDNGVIFAALFGACGWNIITCIFGIPSSSSHALVGGLIGAGIAKAGVSALIASGILKVIAFIVIAPVIGMILSITVASIVFRIGAYFKYKKVDAFFKKAELLSASAFCLTYSGNDAQKTMGIIGMILFSAVVANPDAILPVAKVIMTHHEYEQFIVPNAQLFIPQSVKIACYSAIALGTLSGGWKIIKTMGQKITRLKPIDGFCAESGAAMSLLISSVLGIPVSTTHVITGGIVGVGMFKRMTAVHWGVARRIVWAWFITIPAGAILAAAMFFVGSLFK